MSVGYIPGGINTPGDLTESLSSADLRNLLAVDTSRIATEERGDEVGSKTPSAKRYIVYTGTIQGEMIWTLT